MSDLKSFLGFQWIAGERIPQYQGPLPGDGEPYYAVSSVQLQALIGVLELALAATSEAIPSIDLASWLVGFEAGSEASRKHLTASSGHLDTTIHAPRPYADTELHIRGRSGTGHVPPSKPVSSESSERALSETSDSSSGCADGESTGELPTPPCKKIVIPKDRVDGFTYDGAGNFVVSIKNGWRK